MRPPRHTASHMHCRGGQAIHKLEQEPQREKNDSRYRDDLEEEKNGNEGHNTGMGEENEIASLPLRRAVMCDSPHYRPVYEVVR